MSNFIISLFVHVFISNPSIFLWMIALVGCNTIDWRYITGKYNNIEYYMKGRKVKLSSDYELTKYTLMGELYGIFSWVLGRKGPVRYWGYTVYKCCCFSWNISTVFEICCKLLGPPLHVWFVCDQDILSYSVVHMCMISIINHSSNYFNIYINWKLLRSGIGCYLTFLRV